MPVLTEGRRIGAHIISESEGATGGMRSRDTVTITGDAALLGGTVLGCVIAGIATPAVKASGANTGDGTVSAVTLKDGAKNGVYKVVFTAATKFEVSDPEGFAISKGTAGAAFADDIGFTITAGGTAFVAGDGFDITVALAASKYKALDPAGTDGSQVAAAVLFDDADATDADVKAVVTSRESEVSDAELTWPVGISAGAKIAAIAALAAKGIVVR